MSSTERERSRERERKRGRERERERDRERDRNRDFAGAAKCFIGWLRLSFGAFFASVSQSVLMNNAFTIKPVSVV